MAETPLASSDDVVTALGRALTSEESVQVDAKLAQASGLFRKAAHRTFTTGRKLVRLKVNGGEVRLPESPVTEIHTVTDDEGCAVSYEAFGVTLTVCLLSDAFVRVDYSFGDAEVPELVTTTVADMVARVFNADDHAKAGMSEWQEGMGPFSEGGKFPAWVVGGQVMLSPADQAVAESFRPPKLSNTVVQS